MKKRKYVVLSRRDGLFDSVSSVIQRESPASEVLQAANLPEAFRILNGFEGLGVLLTDADEASEIVCNAEDFSISNLHFPEQDLRGNPEDEIAFVKRYIRLHLEEDLSLTKLASIVSLSPNYLCVLFKKIEGTSVRHFIEMTRIDRAAYLLTTENTLTGDVGKRVGYHHSSYFCKAFRKYYGMTPKHYRSYTRSRLPSARKTRKAAL
ncbi:MAG: AraC family transcriptional regulator [Lachnospiraceae bacterium]|nr:AraC family transcriptional regulator [Lachnospiraceae bacterium]